jgi:hypothetical protein
VAEINGRKPGAEEPQEDLDITLPRFRIELTSPEEGIGRVSHVHASSMEDALRKVRDPDRWRPGSGPGSDPNRFRIVEAVEDNDLTEARQQKNARRRYLNLITEAGLRALGRTHPHRSEEDHFDVLCDFFYRTVSRPGHFAFPGGDTDRLLGTLGTSEGNVLAELLTTHLAHHGWALTRIPPDSSPTPEGTTA